MDWGNRGLRIRLTALATLVVAAGLVIGAILMVVLLRHSLTSSLDDGARRTGREVAALGVPPPDPIPVGGGNTVVVQVVNRQNRVIGAAGATADHLFPLLQPNDLAAVRAGKVLHLNGDRAGVAGSLRVVGVAAGSGPTRATVVVAVDPSGIGQSSQALRNQLFIFVPVLVAALALLSYFVIGRALRPVEDLRRGAAEISGAAQTGGDAAARRLPVPAGRDEVHRLALTLNDMLARLAAASARQRSFIADAAHELRSPLASLRAQLEVAQHLGPRADWPVTADGALIDIGRLSRLVDDLLLLARLDESAGIRRSVVDLPELVAEVAAGYEHARVPVHVTSEGSGLVEGDADGLRRVVRNLLDNAVRHAAGQVAVATSGSSRRVVLTVTDDGPGIAEADRERVFDRFTRLDDARSRDAGGSGLGLAIVRDLVRAHGGTVALGEVGPGLRVTVRLPVAGTPTPPDVPAQLAGEPQRRA